MASTTAAGLVGVAAVVVVLGFATDRIDFSLRYLNVLPRQESDQCAVPCVRGIAQSPIEREYYGETYGPACRGNTLSTA